MLVSLFMRSALPVFYNSHMRTVSGMEAAPWASVSLDSFVPAREFFAAKQSMQFLDDRRRFI
jgi:hypothetical protein